MVPTVLEKKTTNGIKPTIKSTVKDVANIYFALAFIQSNLQ